MSEPLPNCPLPVPAVTGETSDGFHTFNELYAHRNALWMALCRQRGGAWRSRLHADGTSFPGWFVLGLGKIDGAIMTYHLPDNLWVACSFAEALERGVYDGHTANDVLTRLGRDAPGAPESHSIIHTPAPQGHDEAGGEGAASAHQYADPEDVESLLEQCTREDDWLHMVQAIRLINAKVDAITRGERK